MHARFLTRRTAGLLLAWFLAFIVIAGIAPRTQAQPMDSVCSASGMMNAGAQGGDDSTPHNDHTLKCPVCTGVSAPPPGVAALPPSTTGLAYALLPRVAAHLASVTRAPLPARGPPQLS